MCPLFETVLKHAGAGGRYEGPLQLQISALDYSSYVGRIGIGRMLSRQHQAWPGSHADGGRQPKEAARQSGAGLPRAWSKSIKPLASRPAKSFRSPAWKICPSAARWPRRAGGAPLLGVDEPTLTMNFKVNTSPFAGQEGKFVTTRQIRDRLNKELLVNVALRVEETPGHRRVSGLRPRRIAPDHPAGKHAPRRLRTRGRKTARGDEGNRRGQMQAVREPYRRRGGVAPGRGDGSARSTQDRLLDMVPDGRGRVRLDYRIPARGLIGFKPTS